MIASRTRVLPISCLCNLFLCRLDTPRPACYPNTTPWQSLFPFSEEYATMTESHWDGLTRRRFLQTGAAATVGLAGMPALLRADDKADAFGGFTFGVQSYS